MMLRGVVHGNLSDQIRFKSSEKILRYWTVCPDSYVLLICGEKYVVCFGHSQTQIPGCAADVAIVMDDVQCSAVNSGSANWPGLKEDKCTVYWNSRQIT